MSPLSQQIPGASLRVGRIEAGHNHQHELAAYGIVPGAVLHLYSRTPAFVVRIGETTLALDKRGAGRIWVTAEK